MLEPDTRAATMDRYITATQVLPVTDIVTVIAGFPGYGVNKDGRLLIRLAFLKTGARASTAAALLIGNAVSKKHQAEATSVRGFCFCSPQ